MKKKQIYESIILDFDELRLGGRFKQIVLNDSSTGKRAGILNIEIIKDQVWDEKGMEKEQFELPNGIDKMESEKDESS